MAAPSGPNWLGLLQWSLAHSDGTTPTSQVKKMGDEDRKWLEAVMKDNVKDEPARMNQIMSEIVGFLKTSTCSSNEELIEVMLEELRDITEQIDMAQIFIRFGGLTCLLGLLESPEPLSIDTRCLAVGVIGTLSQNNTVVQEEIYKKGVVDKLSKLTLTNESFVLTAKVLYAISCIIRNFPPAEVHFACTYGPSVFLRAVESGKASLATRAIFLSNALITADSSSTEMISAVTPSLLPGCLPFVSCFDINLREATLRLLVSLAKTAAGRTLLTTLNSSVESALKERVTAITADPDYADQLEHEQELIREYRAALTAPVCLPHIGIAKCSTTSSPKESAEVVLSEDKARSEAETDNEIQHTLLLGAP